MTAGMAAAIATHKQYEDPDNFNAWCACGWEAEPIESHAAHVAEELAKAGYGKLDVAHG